MNDLRNYYIELIIQINDNIKLTMKMISTFFEMYLRKYLPLLI